MSETFEVIEICAGAGGQALGLKKAGFTHRLAIELDHNACATLRANFKGEEDIVREGDVADPDTWVPEDHRPDKEAGLPELALLAGGVPCPPFTIAGKQLGANDERDLFAWAVEQVNVIKPRAVMLENVRGLSMPRFAGYRQHVMDQLVSFGYVAEWRLLHAAGFGVPQLRPRFVLVALQKEYADHFSWPEESEHEVTVADAIGDLMGKHNWEGLEDWKKKASKIAPTIVGGSKKHGGADLGPTRAKRAWAELGVDAMGLADDAPKPGDKFEGKPGPKLTNEMVARIQGWAEEFGDWEFTGRKTSNYRQIGNAFPPPMAFAVGKAIMRALQKQGKVSDRQVNQEHDPVYRALRKAGKFVTVEDLKKEYGLQLDIPELEKRISLISQDFEVKIHEGAKGVEYKLGDFKAFVGQDDHVRHEAFQKNRTKIS